MKLPVLFFTALASLTLSSTAVHAHCQVPCGVFTDQIRFEQMLEDHTTIAKAAAQITELSEKTDALSANQLSRWVATKDDHAAGIQSTIAKYFMAQRIKTDDPEYDKKLKAAHAVMIAAMKSKQNLDADTMDALKEAVLDFYRAYEGKEPETLHSH